MQTVLTPSTPKWRNPLRTPVETNARLLIPTSATAGRSLKPFDNGSILEEYHRSRRSSAVSGATEHFTLEHRPLITPVPTSPPSLQPPMVTITKAPSISINEEDKAVNITPVQLEEISQAEFNNFFRMFKSFDTDGSGTIDSSELLCIMNALGVQLTDNEARAIINDMDTHKDGHLEFDDFLQLMLRNRDICQAARGRGAEARRRLAAMREIYRMSPDDPWRLVWDFVLLLITLYYAITVPLRDWFYYIGSDYEYLGLWANILEIFLSLFLAFEIWCLFNMAYVTENRTLETNLDHIRNRYLKTWFLVDLLAASPFDIILRVLLKHQSSAFFMHLRLLRLLRIRSLWRPTELDSRLSAFYIHFYYHFIPIIKIAVWFVVMVHFLGIVLLFITGFEKEHISYTDAIYWVLYTISTTGFGDIPMQSNLQKWYANIMFILAILLNGVVVAKLSELLQDKSLENDRRMKLRDTLAVLTNFGVPVNLRNEVLAYQQHMLHHNLSHAYAEVLAGLPVAMQDQLGLYMRMKFISTVPLFSSLSSECRAALALKLTNLVVPPEEFIVVTGEPAREMFFLGHGYAEVLAVDGTCLACLRKGTFFGETALMSDTSIRTASVKAITFCDLFALQRDDFLSICQRFPTFHEAMQNESKRRRPVRNSLNDSNKKVEIIGANGGVLLTKERQSSLLESQRSLHSDQQKAGVSPTAIEASVIDSGNIQKLEQDVEELKEDISTIRECIFRQEHMILKMMEMMEDSAPNSRVGTETRRRSSQFVGREYKASSYSPFAQIIPPPVRVPVKPSLFHSESRVTIGEDIPGLAPASTSNTPVPIVNKGHMARALSLTIRQNSDWVTDEIECISESPATPAQLYGIIPNASGTFKK